MKDKLINQTVEDLTKGLYGLLLKVNSTYSLNRDYVVVGNDGVLAYKIKMTEALDKMIEEYERTR